MLQTDGFPGATKEGSNVPLNPSEPSVDACGAVERSIRVSETTNATAQQRPKTTAPAQSVSRMKGSRSIALTLRRNVKPGVVGQDNTIGLRRRHELRQHKFDRQRQLARDLDVSAAQRPQSQSLAPQSFEMLVTQSSGHGDLLRSQGFELLRNWCRNRGFVARVNVGTELIPGDFIARLAGRALDRQDPLGGNPLSAAQYLRNRGLRNTHNLANRCLVSQNCDRDFQCINANPAHKQDDKVVYWLVNKKSNDASR
jgi:hypothetical protein